MGEPSPRTPQSERPPGFVEGNCGLPQTQRWVTPVGSGEFHNLTHGSAPGLVNPSIRTLGFSPDGSLVTFWIRRPGLPNGGDIRIWADPALGGEPRPYLEGWPNLTGRATAHGSRTTHPAPETRCSETDGNLPRFPMPIYRLNGYRFGTETVMLRNLRPPVWSPWM
jgi:hypothetical protein